MKKKTRPTWLLFSSGGRISGRGTPSHKAKERATFRQLWLSKVTPWLLRALERPFENLALSHDIGCLVAARKLSARKLRAGGPTLSFLAAAAALLRSSRHTHRSHQACEWPAVLPESPDGLHGALHLYTLPDVGAGGVRTVRG